jgi:hypothetical protein
MSNMPAKVIPVGNVSIMYRSEGKSHIVESSVYDHPVLHQTIEFEGSFKIAKKWSLRSVVEH